MDKFGCGSLTGKDDCFWGSLVRKRITVKIGIQSILI